MLIAGILIVILVGSSAILWRVINHTPFRGCIAPNDISLKCLGECENCPFHQEEEKYKDK